VVAPHTRARSRKDDPITSFPHRPLAVLGLLTIVAYGSWYYGFGVLLDDIAADLGSGLGTITIGFTIAQILTGVLAMPAGRALDRHGARRPLAIGAASGPLLLGAAASAGSGASFAISFGVGGGIIGASGFYHLTQTIAARLAPGSEARAISRLTIWGAFSSPLLVPLTELARATIGWRWTLRTGAVVVALVLAVAAVTVDPQRRTCATSPSTSIRAALTLGWGRAGARRLVASALTGSFGASILMVLQVPAMVGNGLDRSTAATLAGARGITQLLGRLPLSRVLSRHSARSTLIMAKLLIGLGAILLALTTSVATGLVFVVVAGIGIGAVSPLEAIYAREVLPAEDLGVLMGALSLIVGFAAGLGPLAGAMLADRFGSVDAALVASAAASLAAAMVLAGGRRTPVDPVAARQRQ
jgi:MFS family permease